jgi:hypothetical protein
MRARLLWLAVLAMSSSVATAAMYRWVDSKGQVHFTQVPPEAPREYEVIGNAPPPSAAPNQDSLNQTLQKSVQDAPKQKEQADKVAQAKALRQERCTAAMNHLQMLDAQTARRLATKDAQGNPVRMSEDEFQKERTVAQKDIKDNCD